MRARKKNWEQKQTKLSTKKKTTKYGIPIIIIAIDYEIYYLDIEL